VLCKAYDFRLGEEMAKVIGEKIRMIRIRI
jgi:hypothetical protein